MSARVMLGLAALCVALDANGAASAQHGAAQHGASVRVERVVGASGAARDVVAFEGRLLVATQRGLLVRDADGSERLLGPAEAMPGARLVSVSVTAAGVWVGGVEGTVLLDRALHVVRRLPLVRVSRVADFAGQTYAASFGRGLFRIAAGAPVHLRLGSSHARERQTDALVVGDELWVSTSGAGILRVGADGALRARITSVAGLVDDLVWDLELTHEGDVLAATASGVSEIHARRIRAGAAITRATSALPIPDVRAVSSEPGGALVGTYGGGLFRVRGAHAQALSGAADAESSRVRALGRVGASVFAATDAGLAQISDGRCALVSAAGLDSADLTSLARAFGSVWLGTFDRGLARLVGGRLVAVGAATGRWRMDGRVNDLAVTGRADAELLYIATDRGLYRHDGRSFVPVVEQGGPPQAHITSLFVEPGGDVLWVTGSDYLGRFDGQRWRSWTGAALPSAHLHAVTRDAAGRVWVGSLRGLFELDVEQATFTRHDVATGELPVNWVTAITPWGDGIVAGTYHGGLSWSARGAFRIERESSQGLPAGWVNPHAMVKIRGDLWLGTQARGLLVGASGHWTHLTLADGLPSDDVTDILADGPHAAWVATRGGLAHVVTDAPPAPAP